MSGGFQACYQQRQVGFRLVFNQQCQAGFRLAVNQQLEVNFGAFTNQQCEKFSDFSLINSFK